MSVLSLFGLLGLWGLWGCAEVSESEGLSLVGYQDSIRNAWNMVFPFNLSHITRNVLSLYQQDIHDDNNIDGDDDHADDDLGMNERW